MVKKGPKIFLSIVLFILLVIGALFWFDFLNLFDISLLWQQSLEQLGIIHPTVDDYDSLLLERIRLDKLSQAVDAQFAEIEQRSNNLDMRERQLDAREQAIDEQTDQLMEQQETFNQRQESYENRMMILAQNARYLRNMPPENAVEILESYDDQLLINILRVAEMLSEQEGNLSIVPVWLARLNPNRVAILQRKMLVTPLE